MDALNAFLASPAGLAAQGMLGLAFLDTVLGIWAASSTGTFDLSVLGSFLMKHVLGRVFPVTVLLAGGYFLNQPQTMAGAIAAAAAYTAETVGSLLDSIGQVRGDPSAPADEPPTA